MTSILAKYIATKVLGETAKNRFGKDDPYFERVPADDMGGRPSKKVNKKQPKAFPLGISEHDKKVLTKARRRAYILDYGFNICGLKFGMSSLIGLVPGFGDVLDAFMAFMVIETCKKVDGGLPSEVYGRMYRNVVLDFLVGLVPFLGDIADAVFRANTRNVVLLEKYLREQGEAAADAHAGLGPPPGYYESSNNSPDRGGRTAGPRQPEQARVRTDRERGQGGWFGWGGPRRPERDIERDGAHPSVRVA